MALEAGPNAQTWCHTPLTHWMCTGYRFDLLDGVKVEGLCSCDCHKSGQFRAGSLGSAFHGTTHAVCIGDDPERFERARVVSFKLY